MKDVQLSRSFKYQLIKLQQKTYGFPNLLEPLYAWADLPPACRSMGPEDGNGTSVADHILTIAGPKKTPKAREVSQEQLTYLT